MAERGGSQLAAQIAFEAVLVPAGLGVRIPLMNIVLNMNGGERGIRTPETVARLHAFQACAFSHSATSPFCFAKATQNLQPVIAHSS